MMRRLIVADQVRDSSRVLGDALVVDGGKIAAVGQADQLRAEGMAEERFPGTTIVPGLVDAHLHPIGHAAAITRPSLKEARDFVDLADILSAAQSDLADGAALTALRLDDETLAEGRLPTREFLDRIAPDRPLLLVRYCGHISVANSFALHLAGLDESTADPIGGSMDRDAAGRLTGVLRETAADPVSSAIRSLGQPVTTDDLVDSAFALASVGITGVGAMVSTEAGCWAGAGSEIDVLIAAAPAIPISMGVMVIAATPAELEESAQRIASAGGKIRFTGLKVFSDGSFGGHTAAMHEGFADKPDELGTDRLDVEWCLEMARTSLRIGGNVAIHAIGDRANSGVLDIMETLIGEGADPSLLRIEHASVLTASDIARFGRLGITASVQPAFLASETTWIEKRMGAERLQRTYPFRSLADAGAPLAGGSDCPVEPPHPLWGMAAARDRCGLVPEQSLTSAEALDMFTTGAARSVGQQGNIGEGNAATFTVLDRDPMASTPDELRSAAVVATWVDGHAVAIPNDVVVWRG